MGMDSQHYSNGADAVGQRLSLRIDRVDCPGMVIAYFPKTQKHRVRFDEEPGREEKNLRLKDYSSLRWINTNDRGDKLSSLQLAIRCDAAGRRLEVYNQVRRKWFQGTILKYVQHCQQHTLEIEPQGKVHMIDLTQPDLVWRYTDLVGGQETPKTSTLDMSKYRGVQRLTLDCWKALYEPDTLVGCFATEKDAALAYDVYARKRGTPVNFEDRRICRQVMKTLRIPEPELEQEESLVAEDSQNNSSSNNNVPVVETTPDTPLVVKKANHQDDSDATPSLEMEETDLETESTGMVSSSSHSNSNDQDQDQASPSEPPPTRVRRRISVDEEEEDDDDNNNNNNKPISAKKAAAQVRAQLQTRHEDSEFEFEDDQEDHNGQEEDSDDEEFTSSSSESDDDNVVVRPRKTRGRSQKKACPENLFEDSEDEDEAPKTKGRKRALQELQSYNAPPKSKSEKPGRRKRNRARWPVGTRFVKEFPEFGAFEGRITEWDGKHYHVYYSEDEDEEELSEREFDNYQILSVPGGNKGKLVAQQKKRRKERKQKRARLV